MHQQTNILLITAASIGFIHTVLGPDHYLPFVMMAKARAWSKLKLCLVTILCGLGHVLSSVILGFAGITLGVAVFKLEKIEAIRGEIAAWLLLGFGFAYFIWGVKKAVRSKAHEHAHTHENGISHSHHHSHTRKHLHVHATQPAKNITPWILFTIFVFGPCEPLIPILMYPAAKGSLWLVGLIALTFAFATIATMLATVFMLSQGLTKLPLGKLERYSHALAGLIIFLSGGAIKFLGL